MKGGRVLDYIQVLNAGDSDYRVGDKLEKSELLKANEELRSRKKRAIDWEPFSFYLSAWEEDRHTIAQANIDLDADLNITEDLVNARKQGNFVLVPNSEVDYVLQEFLRKPIFDIGIIIIDNRRGDGLLMPGHIWIKAKVVVLREGVKGAIANKAPEFH